MTLLKNLVGYLKGKKPKILTESKSKEFSMPYIDIKAFEKGIIRYWTNGEKCNFCEKDDILLVWDGARCGLVGRGIKGAIGSTLSKIETKHIDKSYLYHFLKEKYYYLNTNSKGIGIPHINPDVLWNLEFPLVPLPEQHRIVAKLEELFSQLDSAVAALKKAKLLIKTYRQSVLSSAFSGKLILNSELRMLNEETGLPEGWKLVKLSDIAKRIQIGPFGTQLHKSDYIENGTPLINPIHFKSGNIIFDIHFTISELKKSELLNYILNVGDIIMGRRGEMGRCALITEREKGWLCGTGSLFIRLNQVCFPKYFSHYLRSQMVKKYLENEASGTTMSNLNLRILKSTPILLPPIEEQEQIVAEIERRFSQADNMEKTIDTALAQSESLRQSILKKAFEGRLVSQDPEDEPASVLLERIRKEKLLNKNGK